MQLDRKLRITTLYVRGRQSDFVDALGLYVHGEQTNVLHWLVPIDPRPGPAARGKITDRERADLKFAQNCFRFCREYHAKTCGMVPQWVRGLKLIDCKTRQISKETSNYPYVALSYLWGSRTPAPPNVHDGILKEVPKVIEDAMTVASSLGISFLWVDKYCIDQANEKERCHMIQNMDWIYEGAE
ncbi:HET-domain-containing protein [Eremomyces bilateralis CBS 781.70]|uniref:HET-domain-containing protein n=1 Tax=Eremomyces bilateralis CBS 781.70 TaxID=1392243 RepID=A0A6G1G2A4_9PEZI|nr:HET-domain-containing protein [Eremomyces bilateralis CBS 781.70]KAF1812148.1 HET-domain-containing protein [Eremomyces bilateralis CBS 781.70]